MTENVCRVVCEADLRSDLMSSIGTLDLTQVTDRVCNSAMFVTDDAGLVDAADVTSGPWLEATSPRSRVVTSFSEIVAHYAPTSEVYEAARLFFLNSGTRGVAAFFHIGWWDIAGGEAVATAMDLISACNPCWSHLSVVHFDTTGAQLMDDLRMLQLAEWAQLNQKLFYTLSIDPLNEDNTSAVPLKAQASALGLDLTWVDYTTGECGPVLDATGQPTFYAVGVPVFDELGNPVDDPNNPGNQLLSDGSEPILTTSYPYQEFLVAGYAAGQDLSQVNSGYTMAYKPQGGQGWVGTLVDSIDNGVVTQVTGLNVDGTINGLNNGHANMYVQTAGYKVVTNGMMVTGTYLDQAHLGIFLKRQLQDVVATLKVNSRRVPYDNARGQALLANAVASVLATAQDNGHFTRDPQAWEENGTYIRKGTGWVIRQASFNDQQSARRNARLAPAMEVCYIPASATHHTPIVLCTLSVQNAA